MLLTYIANGDICQSERDLSHIELARSDNISSVHEVSAYRVGDADISTN